MYAGTLSYFAGLQARHQLANAQGQQIYKIDQTNIDTVLPKLNLSNPVKQDIQSSVNAGKYVITHTDNVSVPGWSGAGYAVIDPLTGSDAYMISGGENGGWVELAAILGSAAFLLGVSSVSIEAFILGSLILGPLGPFFAVLTIISAMVAIVYSTFLLSSNNQLDRSIFFGVIDSLFGIITILGGKEILAGILGLTSGLYTLLTSL